jgi:hypothetical protein
MQPWRPFPSVERYKAHRTTLLHWITVGRLSYLGRAAADTFSQLTTGVLKRDDIRPVLMRGIGVRSCNTTSLA